MEHQINKTPFAMNELSEKFFNLEFLSDIKFLIADHPPIYAHSLELMKRSSVFQEQLQSTYNEKKLISITGYRYETFYEFIRYIYTDDCVVGDETCMELFKLAKTYNVIRLENFITSKLDEFQLFEVYGLPNSDINSVYAKHCLSFYTSTFIDESGSFNEKLMEEVLKLDHADVSELMMLYALDRWIDKQCESNQIPLGNRRQRFDKLIRLIRFPAMTINELRQTKIDFPDLLTRTEYANITEQMIFGAECKGAIWNGIRRTEMERPFEDVLYHTDTMFVTKFSVLNDMVLVGFVQITPGSGSTGIFVEISSHNNTTKEISSLNFTTPGDGIINLGRTIRLVPNHTYTIGYKYKGRCQQIEFIQRKPGESMIVHDPTNSVNILQAHEAMLEIFFEKPS